MATLTQFLKLYKPVANEVGWDDNMNSNLDIVDAFVRQFMNIPGFQGVWLNNHTYAVGQNALDAQTSGVFGCLVAHTSATTGTFGQDRTAHPTFWQLTTNPASQSAAQAAASASAAATSATAANTSLKAFQNTYYGAFATDPLNDPNGGVRTDGDLYFNTTTSRLRVYSVSSAGWIEITTTFADAPTTPTGAVFVRTAAHNWVQGVAQTGGTFTGGIVLGGPNPTLGIGIVPPLAGVASNAYMGHLIAQNVWAQNLYFSQTAPSPATGGWRYMTALPNPIPAAGALGAFVVNSVATGSTGFVGDRFTTFYSTPSGELAPKDGVATLMPVMQFRTFKQGAPAVNTLAMTCFGGAFKPGGGTWADSSDARIKNIVGPYPHGLAELLEMLPQMFTYKGNDQMVKPDGTPGDVIHSDTVTQHIGLIAQECEPYMPELVTTTTAYVDGVLVDDVRQLDATGVIYALVNAVAELDGKSVGHGGTITGDITMGTKPDGNSARMIFDAPAGGKPGSFGYTMTDGGQLQLCSYSFDSWNGFGFSSQTLNQRIPNGLWGAIAQPRLGSFIAYGTMRGYSVLLNDIHQAGMFRFLRSSATEIQIQVPAQNGYPAITDVGGAPGAGGSGGTGVNVNDRFYDQYGNTYTCLTTDGAGVGLTFRMDNQVATPVSLTNPLPIVACSGSLATGVALNLTSTFPSTVTLSTANAEIYLNSTTSVRTRTTLNVGATANNALAITPGAAAGSSILIAPSGTGAVNLTGPGLIVGAVGTNNNITIGPGATATTMATLTCSNTTGGLQILATSNNKLAFFGGTPAVKPTVTGSRGGNAALASLITALTSLGLVIDSSTA